MYTPDVLCLGSVVRVEVGGGKLELGGGDGSLWEVNLKGLE